jgi:serine protease Do
LSTLFEKVKRSVVVIETVERSFSNESSGEMVTSNSIGSGVVVSSDGLIMTAAHVVHVADVVNVKMLDGGTFSATVLGSIESADVALIKLDVVPKGLSVAQLGRSASVKIGEEVFVVGAPYGVAHTLTVGHISGRRQPENISAQLVPIEFLQTDAAINQGNSGGPMFNMRGEVVGIVSSILTQSGGFEGLGFAVSIDIARELLLKQRPFYVGLEVYFLHDKLARALNLPQAAGLLVQRVAADSLGHRLGFRPGSIAANIDDQEVVIGGDVILEVQGIEISNDVTAMKKLQTVLSQLAPGEVFSCKVLRAGEIIVLATQKS